MPSAVPHQDDAVTDPAIGWLVFDNPERHNAMNLQMWQQASQDLARYGDDPDLRVLVMRGAGDRAFVSGADISQFDKERNNAQASARYSEISDHARRMMSQFPKPLIAMIQGYCFGAGVDIALRADVRLAAANAVFCIPAAKLGLAYGFESVQLLTQLVGPAVAKDLLFSGRRLNAQEALRVGLVNQVVPAAELAHSVNQYASEIAGNAPLSIHSAKLNVNQTLLAPADRDLQAIKHMIDRCFDSQDYAEGRLAFAQKRKPAFRNR